MTLSDYVGELHARADQAEAVGATAPVHKMYRTIADELLSVSGAEPRPWTTAEVARYLSYTRQHVATLCRVGYFPGAEKPNGGEWRIPAESVLAHKHARKGCKPAENSLQSTPSLLHA